MIDYVVYQHINKTNGKRYIGITCQDVNKRWRKGLGYKYMKNPHFYNSIEKYGWNGFEHQILATGLTGEQAGELEKALIASYDTTNPDKGYNILPGGFDGASSFKGKHHTEEAKEKIREKRKHQKNKANKWVKCVETGEIFESYTAAKDAVGLKGVNSITNALKNGGKAGGFHWEAVEKQEK